MCFCCPKLSAKAPMIPLTAPLAPYHADRVVDVPLLRNSLTVQKSPATGLLSRLRRQHRRCHVAILLSVFLSLILTTVPRVDVHDHAEYAGDPSALLQHLLTEHYSQDDTGLHAHENGLSSTVALMPASEDPMFALARHRTHALPYEPDAAGLVRLGVPLRPPALAS